MVCGRRIVPEAIVSDLELVYVCSNLDAPYSRIRIFRTLIRKITGILLLFGFVAPVATTWCILQVQKKQIRKEVKWKMIEGIDREELVLLKFATEDIHTILHWKHAREFEYRGEMYDIVETHVEGDTTCYWVWWDHEETLLNQKLRSLVANLSGNDPSNRDQQERLLRYFKSLYFPGTPEMQLPQCWCKRTTMIYRNPFFPVLSERPPFPPPDLC